MSEHLVNSFAHTTLCFLYSNVSFGF